MIVTCRTCGLVGEGAKGQKNICPTCSKAYQKQYRARCGDQVRAQQRAKYVEKKIDANWRKSERTRTRDYWRKIRHEAVMAYGGYRCACCGETEPDFLSIDHVFNDGAAHRRSLGYQGNGKGGGSRTMKWLKDHGYPAGFQVLCMNCNHGKARNKGICPHKAPRNENGVKTGEAQTG